MFDRFKKKSYQKTQVEKAEKIIKSTGAEILSSAVQYEIHGLPVSASELFIGFRDLGMKLDKDFYNGEMNEASFKDHVRGLTIDVAYDIDNDPQGVISRYKIKNHKIGKDLTVKNLSYERKSISGNDYPDAIEKKLSYTVNGKNYTIPAPITAKKMPPIKF